MLDWFDHLLTAWDAHPTAMAWILAWVAALVCTQTAKEFLLPRRWRPARAKHALQLLAISIAAIVAFTLWPVGMRHRALLALIVGMSAPTAYTFIQACIRARFPNLADALSWHGVKKRRGGEPPSNED